MVEDSKAPIQVLLLFLFFGQHDKLLVEWRSATEMYRRTSANNSTPSSLNIQTGRWRRKTLGRWWKRFRAIINFDFNTNLSGSAPEGRCWQDGETHVQGLRRQRRRLCRLRGVHGEHIFVFAFVIVFVWFMTGMLTLCIWVMGLCAQMIYYIMSDGSPEEVLAKIFRVFDVNRWQKHLDIGWTSLIFLLQNFFSYIIDCCSIDARFWYCILMGTIHMKISIQLFCDGPVCWTHGSWFSHEENWGNGPYLIKTSAPDLNTLTLDRELAQENVVRKKW